MRTWFVAAMLAAAGSVGVAGELPKAGVSAPSAVASPSNASGFDVADMDLKVRPQDDFYRYVNGGWLDAAQIPADAERITPSSELDKVIRQRLRQLVEAVPADAKGDRQKIAWLYRSFLDEAALEKLGVRPLAQDLERIRHARTVGDICALMGQLGSIGVDSPFSNSVLNDADDPGQYALTLYQSGLGMPNRDYYLDDTDHFREVRAAYRKHVATLLRMAGDVDAEAEATHVVALETQLAKAQWPASELGDPSKTHNKVRLKDLPRTAPGIDWPAYLKASQATGGIDSLILAQPDFFAALGRMLQDTPAPVWQAYLRYRLLSAYAPFLSRAWVDEGFAFESTMLRGIPQNTSRWERGLDLVETSMGEGLGRLYVERYFPPSSKQKLQDMVKHLVEAFRQEIDTQDWMAPSTKLKAKEKLARLHVKIGYPDRWRDYGKLAIEPGDLVGNVRRARAFEYARNMHKLGHPVDKGEWFITPQTVDAYEFPPQNEVVFPAGLMQPPFFDPEADDAANYGAIGGTLGHEISHGFDDGGSQYDADGRLLGKPGWFTEKDREAFDRRAQAFVAQYDGVEAVPGHRVNGALTLSENVADNTGIAMAYQAYRLSLAGKPAPVIDGLTGDQRFFMAWTRKWRAKVRDSETLRLLKSNEHAPRTVRGIVPVRNQDAFYRAFDIKPGDAMYLAPADRVRIW